MDIDITTKIKAAMYAAIPSGLTKFSRSGYSVIFTKETRGRHDLSCMNEDSARAQAEAAGLDLDSVTEDQIAAYINWYENMYSAREIEQAALRVTQMYPVERRHTEVKVNRVDLIDGWGHLIGWIAVNAVEFYDSDAINIMGRKGALRHLPDVRGIERAIAALRTQHPAFAAASVQDNSTGARK